MHGVAQLPAPPTQFDLFLAGRRTYSPRLNRGSSLDRFGYVTGGYVRLDDEEFIGGKYKKISTLVGKDAPRALVVDGESGRTIAGVAASALPKEARGGSDYYARTGRSRLKTRLASTFALKPR